MSVRTCAGALFTLTGYFMQKPPVISVKLLAGFKIVLQKKKKPRAGLLWMFSLVLVFLVKNYGSENISKNVV